MANVKKMQQQLKETKKALAAERQADFKWAQGSTDAIYAALGKSLRRRGQRVTTMNQRMLERMGKVVARSNAFNAKTQAAVSKAAPGALAGEAAAAMKPATTAAQAAVQRAENQIRHANAQAFNTQQATVRQQAIADQAQAGAEFATAEALATRTQEDVALVAQMRHDIAMAKLQHKFDMEMYEKQKQEAEKADPQSGAAAVETATLLANAVPIIRQVQAENNGKATVQAVMAALQEAGLVSGGDANEALFVAKLVARVNSMPAQPQGTGGYEAMADAILSVILANTPVKLSDKLRKKLRDMILPALRMAWNNQTSGGAQTDPETGQVEGASFWENNVVTDIVGQVQQMFS